MAATIKREPTPVLEQMTHWFGRTVALLQPPPILESSPVRYEFIVQGMTCKNCVNAINTALLRADGAATVNIDLSQQRVIVESDRQRQVLVDVLLDEGYVAE
jgi:copper chaperone CopZ